MILLDTNVLLRLIEVTHPMHQESLDAVAKLWLSPGMVCIVPQNLYEFWVVATRPLAQNGLGRTPAQTDGHISRFQIVFHLLHDLAGLLAAWKPLVLITATTGKRARDALLV